MRTLFRLFSLVLGAWLFAGMAQAEMPTLEALVGNREVDKMVISPDGQKIAYQKKQGGKNYIVVQNLSGGVVGVTGIGDSKPIRLVWAGNENVNIIASRTIQDVRYRTDHRNTEMVRAISFNPSTKKLISLLDSKYVDLSTYNSNLGNIVGVNEDKAEVFIPAFDEKGHYDLFRVDVTDGKTRLAADGERGGTGWYLGSDNVPVARTSHLQDYDEYRLDTRQGGSGTPWNTIYKEKHEIRPFGVHGAAMSSGKLVVQMSTDTIPYQSLYLMDMNTGDIDTNQPYFTRKGLDVQDTILDPYTNEVIGVSWVEDKEEYHWFDPKLEQMQKDLEEALPGEEVSITSWSQDRSRFVVRTAKPGRPFEYYIFIPASKQLALVAQSRSALTNAALGITKSWPYDARDGMHIPAYVTMPPGKDDGKNLPLVVLPHGGPEARDQITYDWMAQTFATRGYVVLQPNFRGSDGYGWDFTQAGWGEWGKAMQSDITDGVNKLIADGIVDPKRVCIVGASYGGYAALAGGAFTPDLYKCVVSISGIGDLVSFVDWKERESGKSAEEYWKRFIGGESNATRSSLVAVSPERFADKFTAPVLLIHGKDDVVVSYDQSKQMERALKNAGKNVTLLSEDEGDHWMSYESTRMKTARAMLDFVQANIGNPPTGQ